MSIRTEAEENLRVIRSLMEKATVYRAISAPGAAVGGVLATVMAGATVWSRAGNDCTQFVWRWVSVLAFTAVINFALLYRDASRRGEPFISAGMRLALRAMLPALLGGGLAIAVGQGERCALVASLWVLFYGIALLAAAHFAPKSICWLGRAFFCAGAVLLVWIPWVSGGWDGPDSSRWASLIMGNTFGLFHLIYAGFTLRGETPAESDAGKV